MNGLGIESLKRLSHSEVIELLCQSRDLREFSNNFRKEEIDGHDLFYHYQRYVEKDFTQALERLGLLSLRSQRLFRSWVEEIIKSKSKQETEKQESLKGLQPVFERVLKKLKSEMCSKDEVNDPNPPIASLTNALDSIPDDKILKLKALPPIGFWKDPSTYQAVRIEMDFPKASPYTAIDSIFIAQFLESTQNLKSLKLPEWDDHLGKMLLALTRNFSVRELSFRSTLEDSQYGIDLPVESLHLSNELTEGLFLWLQSISLNPFLKHLHIELDGPVSYGKLLQHLEECSLTSLQLSNVNYAPPNKACVSKIQNLCKMNKQRDERRKQVLTLLLCSRKYEAEHLFGDRFLSLDVFKKILGLAGITTQSYLLHQRAQQVVSAQRLHPLLTACKRGDVKLFQKLSTADFSNLDQIDEYGMRPLSWACLGSSVMMVSTLLDKGADINAKDELEMRPIYWAGVSGNYQIFTRLLDAGAQMYEGTLLIASCFGNEAIVSKLLQSGCQVNYKKKDQDLSTPAVCLASARGHAAVVEVLLKYGANVQSCNTHYQSSLHLACIAGHLDVVKVLLKSNADIDAVDTAMHTPLSDACANGHKEIVQLLLHHGADCNIVGALHQACAQGHAGIAELCIKSGADVDVKYQGRTPLHFASGHGHQEVVELLIKNGAGVNVSRDAFGATPLSDACENGHTHIAQLLIRQGAQIDEDLLPSVCQFGHADVAELLLANGADVNFEGIDKKTALHCAASFGRTSTVQVLLKYRADLSARDKEKKTPLQVASTCGYLDIVDLLFQK